MYFMYFLCIVDTVLQASFIRFENELNKFSINQSATEEFFSFSKNFFKLLQIICLHFFFLFNINYVYKAHFFLLKF